MGDEKSPSYWSFRREDRLSLGLPCSVDGVDEDKDDAGVAKAGSSVATPL